MNHIVCGKVWKTGDDITAYQIIGQKRWTLNGLDPNELGKWAFEGALPEVENVEYGFKALGYNVVVAGRDFGGGGKSIEHPIVAMQGAGITLVIAESFSRYNFRNAINLGLPAMTCPGITEIFSTGDEIHADLLTGEIQNVTKGNKIKAFPLSDYIIDLLSAGGVLNYYRGKV